MTVEQFKSFLSRFGLSETQINEAAQKYSEGIAAASRSASSSSSSSTTKLTGNVLQNIANAAAAGFYDRLSQTQARISVDTIETMLGKLSDIPTLNPFTLITNILNASAALVEKTLGDMAKLDDDLLKATKGTSGYVGAVGDAMIGSLREAVIATTRLGVSVDEFVVATSALMENSQRMALYSEETIYAGMEASMAYTNSSKTLLENAEAFRDVGIGLGDASKAINEIGNRSVSLGLSAKATSETLIKQLGKLNEFGFQNGIKGLGKMVQEAQALRINMDEIFKVAVDLYDPEKAINLAANLQVVGGAVGDLADPIKLMYDATNNVESLQSSIIDAARSLATYNAEQGRFEVTGANLRRAKAMADALNISMGELTNMAIKGSSKFEAMSRLDLFPDLTNDQKEFVSNLSTIKDGKVGFDLPDDMARKMGLTNLNEGFIAIDDLTTGQILQFKEMQEKIAKTSTVDIARDQLNKTTQIASSVSAIYLRLMQDARQTSEAGVIRDQMKAASDFMYNKFDATKMTTPQMLEKAAQMARDTLGDVITQEQIDAIKSQLPNVEDYIQKGTQMFKEASETINIPEMLEKFKKEMEPIAEPIIDRGREFLRDMGITVKVDLNSGSPELAQVFVAEINKNPKLRSELAQSIFGNKKEFVA